MRFIFKQITDIKGIEVGHAEDKKARTGCTVILCRSGLKAAVDIRGGAPGTREIALLDPIMKMERIHGILLTGGSAFGLNAAGGVMEFLEERDIGYDTGAARVPIVPAAVIYDLALGDPGIRPDKNMGYRACRNASSGLVKKGSVGVGTGATVGKSRGMEHCMKSGLGSAGIKSGDIVVTALVVTNSYGDIYKKDDDEILAGARKDGVFINSRTTAAEKTNPESADNIGNNNYAGGNTTLGVVVTNAAADRALLKRIAVMAHDGYARTIKPVHTMYDGDLIFVLTTGEKKVDINRTGILAAEVIAEAVVDSVS